MVPELWSSIARAVLAAALRVRRDKPLLFWAGLAGIAGVAIQAAAKTVLALL